MAGFTDILGALVQQGMSSSSNDRVSSALGAGRAGGSLEDLIGSLGQMAGGGHAPSSSASGSGGLGGMLGDVVGSLGNNKAALGGLGALAGALMGGGKGATKGAIGGGGLAMLASLAFSALKGAGQAPAQMPRALMEPRTPEDQRALDDDAEIIVRAMINAAKADGRIDEQEIANIAGKLQEGGLTTEEKALFESEAKKPMDLEAVVASARNRPELGAEIYAASLLAIEVDTPAEREYLQRLASGLRIDPQVTSHIERTLGMAA